MWNTLKTETLNHDFESIQGWLGNQDQSGVQQFVQIWNKLEVKPNKRPRNYLNDFWFGV